MSIVTAIVAVVAVAFSAWSIKVTAENAQSDRQLSQRGQASDRYLKAVEALSSPNIDLRLGGIYALQQLLSDSPIDSHQIVSVLVANIRSRAGREKCTPPFDELPPTAVTMPLEIQPRPPADVQAAVEAVGKAPQSDTTNLNFNGLCLRGVRFVALNLDWANFSYADLSFSEFNTSSLAHANFANAVGEQMEFAAVNLDKANFFGSRIYYTRIYPSSLDGTVLTGADFRNSLISTNELTRLGKVEFSFCDLDRVTFDSYPQDLDAFRQIRFYKNRGKVRRWPSGYVPQQDALVQ